MGLSCPVFNLTGGPGTIAITITPVSGQTPANYELEVYANNDGTGLLASDVITGTTKTFTGITAGTRYVRVTPSDNLNPDPVCALQSVVVTDGVGPVQQSAVVQSASPSNVVISYNETLNSASLSLSKWEVLVNGVAASLSSATANGTTVTIVLSAPITTGQTVAVNYTPGSTGTRVADTSANFALGFTNLSVTNNV